MKAEGNNTAIKKIISFFIFSNIFLAFSVTSLVFETYIILFGYIPGVNYSFFLFCSTLALYCFHRIYRFNFSAEEKQLSERHRWTKRNRFIFLSVLLLASSGIVYSLLFFVSMHTVLYLLPVGIISFGYTIPCIPTYHGWIRLRDIPGMKIFFISFVLGFTTVLLPLLEHNRLQELTRPEIVFVFLRRMVFIFAITIPFDIRDMHYDREKGTRTLPLIFGAEKAKYLALAALIFFVLLGVIQYVLFPSTQLYYLIALLISATISSVTVVMTNQKREEIFYSVLVEGMMLLQCLLIIAANKLLR